MHDLTSAAFVSEGDRRMTEADTDPAASSHAERERRLLAREAAVARREEAVRRAEELREDDEVRISLLARREREVEQLHEALEAQRARLDEVRSEYEARRDTMRRRSVELEAERDKLRERNARELAVELENLQLTGDAPSAQPAPSAEAGADWWSKQLGTPLEAA